MRSARLFTAIAFTPGEKNELFALSRLLKGRCAAGRFPEPALLHITLHFFGQTPLDRLAFIEAAMRRAAGSFAPFPLTTGRAGTFGRRDSSVLWLGVDGGAQQLKALQAELEKELVEKGFPPEGREFKAHITLGRDVVVNGSAGEIKLPEVVLSVNGITLMESTQGAGKLEYVPLLAVPLRGQFADHILSPVYPSE